jgi:hypothetical protein
VSKLVLGEFRCQQIKKRRDEAVHLISWPESKIPKAAAAEILEDCIMLWMTEGTYVRIIWKKHKGTTVASWHAAPKGLVHSQSPSVCATSNKPIPNTTNAMQYRKWIDEICLPYWHIAYGSLSFLSSLAIIGKCVLSDSLGWSERRSQMTNSFKRHYNFKAFTTGRLC